MPECTDTQDWKCPQKATIASSDSCIDSQAHGRAWIKNSPLDQNNTIANNERGIALMLTVFVVTIASILVTSLAYRAQFDLRYSRKFAETIQADYVLKSCLALSVALIETPKKNADSREDWSGDIWHEFGKLPRITIFDDQIEARLEIVDDRSKVNINAIIGAANTGTEQSTAELWRSALSAIFAQKGGFQAQTAKEDSQTIGGRFFDANQQIAVIHDWLDSDTVSHQSSNFDFPGIESTANKQWFYNRRFHALEEILLVPGMTKEKLAKIAPYINVPPSGANSNDDLININTASREVLHAISLPETNIDIAIQQRVEAPLDQEDVNITKGTLAMGGENLVEKLTISTTRFSAYAKVKTPNGTRWLHAQITATAPAAGGAKRKAVVQSYSIR